jgi:proteasome lid subunit RPN8/RPN11
MSQVDVRELAREGLPPGRFPADLRADFRVHMTPEVLRGIENHAKADHTVEICGVLVGGWEQDEQGPYATVTDYIRCDNAASKFAEVTFTHESWAQINKEMDSKYADKRIVGWYHSHPDFGIFLSDRDCFIQQHFFSGPGQVAYVIDPVRDLEGVFAWRKGKPTPLPHFWAGDEIRMSRSAEDHPRHEGRGGGGGGGSGRGTSADADAAPVYVERPSAFSITTLLACAGLFLLGYFYSGLLSRAEEQRMTEGVIARFMNAKVLRLGLDADLQKLRQVLAGVSEAIAKLPEAGAKLSAKDRTTVAKQRQLIDDNLQLLELALAAIEDRYALSSEEQAALARLLAEQQALLQAVQKAPAAKDAKPKTPATGGATTGGGTSGEAATGGAARPTISGPPKIVTPPADD